MEKVKNLIKKWWFWCIIASVLLSFTVVLIPFVAIGWLIYLIVWLTKKLISMKKKTQELNNQALIDSGFIETKRINAGADLIIKDALVVDENNKLWYAKSNPRRIYKFSDIVEYELLVDDESLIKGGMGKAIAGGVLFGGVGAVVGGTTAKKSVKKIITNFKIKITVNNFSNPVVYIYFLAQKTSTDSGMYKLAYNSAQQILSTLSLMQKIEE